MLNWLILSLHSLIAVRTHLWVNEMCLCHSSNLRDVIQVISSLQIVCLGRASKYSLSSNRDCPRNQCCDEDQCSEDQTRESTCPKAIIAIVVVIVSYVADPEEDTADDEKEKRSRRESSR